MLYKAILIAFCLAGEVVYFCYDQRKLAERKWLRQLEGCRRFDRGECDHVYLNEAFIGQCLGHTVYILRKKDGSRWVRFEEILEDMAAKYAKTQGESMAVAEDYSWLRQVPLTERAEVFFFRFWPRPAPPPHLK